MDIVADYSTNLQKFNECKLALQRTEERKAAISRVIEIS
jgi:hypothetical protein